MSKTERQWIKVRLKPTAEATHAAEVVEYWRKSKSAAVNVTKAIRMYYKLTIGETTLLREYFPFLLPSSADNQLQTTVPATPSGNKALKSRDRQKSANEDVDDL